MIKQRRRKKKKKKIYIYIYEILFRLEKRFLAIFNWVSSAWSRSWIRLTRRSPPSSFPCAHVLGPLSHVRLFAAPWIVARQAPLSMRFSQQEYWSALPSSPPGNLPDPGAEPVSWSCISYIAGRFFTAEPPGNPPHPLSCCQTAEKLLLCWEVTKPIKNNRNTLKVTPRVTHSYRAGWSNSSGILPNQSFRMSMMQVQNTLPVHQGNGHMISRLTQPKVNSWIVCLLPMRLLTEGVRQKYHDECKTQELFWSQT